MSKILKKRIIVMLIAVILLTSACGNTQTGSSTNEQDQTVSSEDYQRTAGGELIDGDPSTGVYTVLSRKNGAVYVQQAEPTYEQPKNPGTVLIYTNTLVALDPAVTSDEENGWCFNVYEPLFMKYCDADGVEYFEPLLATEWYFDDDGNFHAILREGVKFHDGTDMTAEDVLFTIERVVNTAKSPASAGMQGVDIDGSYAENDYHVVIKFNEPIGGFMNYMSSSYLSIVSKDFVESVGPDYDWWSGDAGTGAYYITETVTGISQTFERFDEYWGGKATMQTIITRRGDTTVMGIDLENGDFDIALQSTYDSVQRVLDGTVTGIDYLLLSSHRSFRLQPAILPESKPLSDYRVREALSMSIDRELLILAVYGTDDFGTPANKQMLDGIDVGVPEYDPDQAREIMSQLGYSEDNPCVLNILTSTTTESSTCLETIQAMASECFFHIQISTVNSGINSAVSSKEFPCEYDAMLTQGKYYTDAEFYFADCDAYQKDVGEFSGLKANDDPEFSRLYNLLSITADENDRDEIIDELNILYQDELYFIPLLISTQPTLVQNYLENVVFRDGLGIIWKELNYKNWVEYTA